MCAIILIEMLQKLLQHLAGNRNISWWMKVYIMHVPTWYYPEEPFMDIARLKVNSWKIIISVLFPKECTHSCVITKLKVTNWVFRFEQDITKWLPHNLNVLRFLKK